MSFPGPNDMLIPSPRIGEVPFPPGRFAGGPIRCWVRVGPGAGVVVFARSLDEARQEAWGALAEIGGLGPQALILREVVIAPGVHLLDAGLS